MSAKRCGAYFGYEEKKKKKRKLDDGAAIHEEDANANELADNLSRLSTSLHNNTPCSKRRRREEKDMSGKRCVANFRYEETKKKRELDDGSEAAIHEQDANANEIADKLGRLSTSLHNYTPSRSNPSGSVYDDDSENKQKLGDSSSSTVILIEESAESGSTSTDSNGYLVYKKRLTRDDVFYHRLVIPLESGIHFLPEPSIFEGRYELTQMIAIDHENHTWEFLASFYDLNNSYLFWKNWDKYVSKYGLQPDDVIFLYEDPDDDSRSHLLIEYQKATVKISN